MPLICCTACGRQISTEAAACPQCGHPNRPASLAPTPCKSCSQPAIGACKKCGKFYCAKHGGGTSYGPLCSTCYVCKRCSQLPISACSVCGGFYCTSHGGDRLLGVPNIRGVTVAVTRRLCDACTPNPAWMRFVLMRQWVAIILIWIILGGVIFLLLALAIAR
jgi:hypothetical protein